MGPLRFTPRPFRPAYWARGPHAQTLTARVLRPAAGPVFERERLTTPDDDFLDLDWGPEPSPQQRNAPIALVVHGLEGSARRGYIRSVCAELLRVCIRPVALNLRGCSGEPNRALQFYHSGKTDDPGFVLATLRARHPERRIGAIGFSLGGNLLLKLVGERDDGGASLVDALVAVSVPYDLAAGSALLERSTMGRRYAHYFLQMLKEKVRSKEARLASVIDVPAAMASRTIWQFDDLVTAPLHGFASAKEYYAKSSSGRFLSGVRTPTLMVHAEDDPFIPRESVPKEDAGKNPALQLVLHARGGHVGFLEGLPWRPSFWADEESARFLAFHLAR